MIINIEKPDPENVTSTILEIPNIYYFANARQVKSEFEIDGFLWSFVYDEQVIRVKLMSDIANGDFINLILHCEDGKSKQTKIAQFSDEDREILLDWESGSHTVQIEVETEFYESQFSGRDFSIPDDLSDVVLEVEDKKFHVHSVILSTISPYFKTLFYGVFAESKNSEKPLILKGFSAEVFKNLLNCIYSYPSNFRITAANVEDLLIASNFYDCQNVTALCENYLLSSESKRIPATRKKQLAMDLNLESLKIRLYLDNF